MSLAAPVVPVSGFGLKPIRVMVVDDAVVVRGLVSRWIDEEPGLTVVASLSTGRQAVDQIERADPDVVILDVEMPELDGLSALPLLLEKKPGLVVIMASTVTRRNAEVSFRALSLGAADYIPKPESSREVTTSSAFRRELIDKVRALAGRARRASNPLARTLVRAPRSRPGVIEGQGAGDLAPAVAPTGAMTLRPFSSVVPRVLLIGSSTGGPQALDAVLSRLGPVIQRIPVLITQHMPPTFTTILAEHLNRASGRPTHEGCDGEPITAGTLYVAPGGRHMRVRRKEGPVIAIDDSPPVNFCRPAVDPLFSSAAQMWGNTVLAVILTGMGHDGTHGAGDIVAAGGSVIAQDEPTSVIWGMPGSVANAGLCAAVLPLDQIASRIVRLLLGDRP
jgi:two-component system chemotaxis response regulator CheB